MRCPNQIGYELRIDKRFRSASSVVPGLNALHYNRIWMKQTVECELFDHIIFLLW